MVLDGDVGGCSLWRRPRSKKRVFLDAAADGDLAAVDSWLTDDGDAGAGDVNATMGEGWTALLYAVAHSRLAIVTRLLQERDIDLNVTTVAGSSALALALTRKNNSLAALLLNNGASRATLPDSLIQEVQAACWTRSDVRHMLSPGWAAVWSPQRHHHFPPAEREKCRLVVYANTLALRRKWTAADAGALPLSLTQANWQSEVFRRCGWIVSSLSGWPADELVCVRWRYLPQPLIHHIIEYAVFLW